MGLFSGVHFRVLKNSIHSSLYIGLFEFSMNKITKKSKEWSNPKVLIQCDQVDIFYYF